MIFNYEINKNLYFIPLHLCIINNSIDKKFYCNYLTAATVNELILFIKKYENKIYIIDMKNIKGVSSRVFERLCEINENLNSVILINTNKLIEDDVLHSWVNSKINTKYDFVISSNLGNEIFSSRYSDKEEFLISIEKEKKRYLANFVFNKSIKEKVFLPSSNLWANMYIDIKNVFSNPNILNLAIYELSCFIDNNYNEKYDEMICVSNNGFAIGNILSHLFDKKVVYLMNLGPYSALMSKNVIDKLNKEKHYLFIYDFSCLGTEIKIVKTIVNLHGSKLVGCIGVANYLEKNDYQENQFSTFKVNDDYDYGYKLFFKENEVVL